MTRIIACPECGHAATVLDRCVLESTDGPVEHLRIECTAGHCFFMPTTGLTRSAAARSAVAS